MACGGTQNGFSLVTAIFLLVVLSALGTMMVTFFGAQQQAAALDVMGTRAYQAARGGLEWAAFQLLRNPSGAFASSCQAGGGATQTLPALANTLAPFTVTVTCTANSYADPSNVWVYRISSSARMTGATPGLPDYVERQMQLTIAQ